MTLKTLDECIRFLDDLCTTKELESMEQRYLVATLLDKGLVYNEILKQTGVSSATISRVNRSLNYGADGYRIAIERTAEREPSDENGKGAEGS